MITKEGSTKIVNFITPRVGVLILGYGHISHKGENVLSSTLSIYSTLIAIVFRDYDAALLYHRWFSFMMGLLIYKYEPFWQAVSVKSLILSWPLRPLGLLSWMQVEIHTIFHKRKQFMATIRVKQSVVTYIFTISEYFKNHRIYQFFCRHFFSMLTAYSLGADKVSIYCIYCCPFSLSKKGRYRRIMSLVTIYAEATIYVATWLHNYFL